MFICISCVFNLHQVYPKYQISCSVEAHTCICICTCNCIYIFICISCVFNLHQVCPKYQISCSEAHTCKLCGALHYGEIYDQMMSFLVPVFDLDITRPKTTFTTMYKCKIDVLGAADIVLLAFSTSLTHTQSISHTLLPWIKIFSYIHMLSLSWKALLKIWFGTICKVVSLILEKERWWHRGVWGSACQCVISSPLATVFKIIYECLSKVFEY